MIFREPLLMKVLAAEKTVTRRPVKYVERLRVLADFRADATLVALDCRYKPGGGPGGTYALQGPPEKGSRARARTIPGYRLRVLSVRRLVLCEIGGRDAELEGFDTPEEFRDYWVGLYGSYDPNQLVDRIEFELVPDAVRTPERTA